jgi:hypothetical protein
MKNRAIRPCAGANAAACGLFCAQNCFLLRSLKEDRSTHSKRSHRYVPAKEGLKEPNSDAAVCQRCGRIIIPAAGTRPAAVEPPEEVRPCWNRNGGERAKLRSATPPKVSSRRHYYLLYLF